MQKNPSDAHNSLQNFASPTVVMMRFSRSIVQHRIDTWMDKSHRTTRSNGSPESPPILPEASSLHELQDLVIVARRLVDVARN